MKPAIERYFVAAVIAVVPGTITLHAAARWFGVAGVVAVSVLVLAAAVFVARRLPVSLDGSLRRRRVLSVAWALLGVLTIVQTHRLSAHMADPGSDWWLTTKHEFWSKHACMSAYFYAADLNRQGVSNVYLAEHYPGLNPDAATRPTVQNLVPEDPYQYPPQFLLLPRLAIALSDDFLVIRTVWYLLQAIGFLLVLFLFARWYGGSAGAAAMWLIPVVWISVPVMLNFQYGQFHVSAIALTVGAFLAFERGRSAAGGALLAAAILAKGFPGIVILPLLFGRRWREVGSTTAWAAALTVLAWAVIGWDPFVSFFQYHLPRLRSGVAFAFEQAWPELTDYLLAGNVSPHSLVRKLAQLGVPGMTETIAKSVHGVFAMVLAVAAILSARVRDRRRRGLVWLALINLAAMTSPAAWGDYVPAGTLWLLTFVTVDMVRSRLTAPVVAAAWVFSVLLPGVVPIGSFPSATPSLVLSIVCTLVVAGINFRIVTGALRQEFEVPRARELATQN
jgi:hypothetical protein